MKKNYVLDTNVLLHDPEALKKFEEHVVNIPISVIEEMDHFKKNMDSIGGNARHISRFLDELRGKGDLQKGVKLCGKGKLRVCIAQEQASLPVELVPDKADNRILAVCLMLKEKEKLPVIFITKDTNLRIKAGVLGIKAEDYKGGKIVAETPYEGVAEINVSPELMDSFFADAVVSIEDETKIEDLHVNQYITLVAHTGQSALCRHVGNGRVVPLKTPKEVWGIKPRNREQKFAMDALLNPDIQLVTLIGRAGTGKTLAAIAAGLQMTMEVQRYQKLLVSRPIFPMGRDLGFLPGDVQEKLRPWMQPIFDNIEFLFSSGIETRSGKKTKGYEELIEMGTLALEPLTYIRGRSIPFQYMIVDEAQNLTPHECKTIVSRAGEGTKIILTGDPAQIDNPYIDALSNGLSYCVERFKGNAISAHITMQKGERSELAELAAKLL